VSHQHRGDVCVPLVRCAELCPSLFRQIIPVYVFDPRDVFGTTQWGSPKTGSHRARFLLECVTDLRHRLRVLGSNLLVGVGKPESLLPGLAIGAPNGTTYLWQEQVTSEELAVDLELKSRLSGGTKTRTVWGGTLFSKDSLPWSKADNNLANMPDTFSGYRKNAETLSAWASAMNILPKLKKGNLPLPKEELELPEGSTLGWDMLPELQDLRQRGTVTMEALLHTSFGLPLRSAGVEPLPLFQGRTDVRAVMDFKGGESEALERLQHYLWESDCMNEWYSTRGSLSFPKGKDYSSKFSPWLAAGCLSPRVVAADCTRYEQERYRTKATYWFMEELLRRDFYRFAAVKHGKNIFAAGGALGEQRQKQVRAARGQIEEEMLELILREQKVSDQLPGYIDPLNPQHAELQSELEEIESRINQLKDQLESIAPSPASRLLPSAASVQRAFWLQRWKDGLTGVPLVDANMRELAATGWMSSRGRRVTASYLIHCLGLDWRAGADHFESLLIDYDVTSNWGNWAQIAGLGGGPPKRLDIVQQSKDFDPDGLFIRHWIPELFGVPDNKIHTPWLLTSHEQKQYIVLLGQDGHYPMPSALPDPDDGDYPAPGGIHGRRTLDETTADQPATDAATPPTDRQRLLAPPRRLEASAPVHATSVHSFGVWDEDICETPHEAHETIGPWNKWQEAWQSRLEEWWAALPMVDQAAMGNCMGALGLHLGARFQAARRAWLALRGKTDVAAPPPTAGAVEPGCEFIGEKSYFSLPDFPSFPSEPDAIEGAPVLPIPRLLPRQPQLDGQQLSRSRGFNFGAGLGMGAAAGVTAGVIAMIIARSCRRARGQVAHSGRVALHRRKPSTGASTGASPALIPI